MRRWLLFLLIAILPLQSVWAAAGMCVCIDDGKASALAATVQAHLDAVAQGVSPDADDQRNAGDECSPLCSVCHLGCAQLPQSEPLLLDAPPPHRPVQQDLTPLQDHIPDGLDRPDWQRRA